MILSMSQSGTFIPQEVLYKKDIKKIKKEIHNELKEEIKRNLRSGSEIDAVFPKEIKNLFSIGQSRSSGTSLMLLRFSGN